MLNTAIDSNCAHEGLQRRAQAAMDRWQTMLQKIIRYGQKRSEIKPEVDPEVTATIVIATLEGAVMMSGLYGDRTHLNRARDHLMRYVDSLLVPP